MTGHDTDEGGNETADPRARRAGERDAFAIVGRVATVTAILMYVSYIPQIIGNLHGDKSSPVQPLVAAINCTLWVVYGFFKKERDLPVVIANLPGILFGIFAALTAF
ncbi:SWEET family sugar transporter [Mycetocola spongiae]|nr:SWEET family sugar transporter [Mycetocola spongiae]